MNAPVLFEHAKRGGVTVKVTIADYNGSRFLDIREWIDRDGKPMATRKGATMPLDGIAGLHASLEVYLAENAAGGPSSP